MAKKKPDDVIAVKFRKGFPSAKVKPEAAYKAIEAIKKKNSGKVTANLVIDAAAAIRHPLHKQFEWDDSVAGAEYRLKQARDLVGAIEVEYREAPAQPVKAYNVTTQAAEGDNLEAPDVKVYKSTADILADPDGRAELLARALRELLGCQRRFRGLQELAPVFRAIGEVLETVEVEV